MATPIKYKPSQKVNIGVGKDNLNDFARKYNLEIEEIYDILNLRSARQVYFRSDSVHWEGSALDGYTLTLPHNGNAVFGVYTTNYETGTSELVSTGVSMDETNVTVTADAPFDGFLMYAGLNDEAGMGSNLSDDVVQQIIDETKDEFDDRLTDAQNYAESDVPFNTHDEGSGDPPHNSAKYYAEAAAETYSGLLAINTPEYLERVVAMLEEQASLLTSGYWDTDVYGNIMPKNTSETDANWELDLDDNLMPTA